MATMAMRRLIRVNAMKNTNLLSKVPINRVSSHSIQNYTKAEEVTIPVPWGHIAGKRWGNAQGKPILAVHGWLDNAASMDGLIQLMPLNDYNILAIDLPGHGFSSHYAPGMTYRLSDAMITLRRLQMYLRWDKSSIIGHSLGAAVGSWFAAIFPEHIDRLVLIDLINIPPSPLQKHVKATRKSLEKDIKLNDVLSKNTEPPAYTFEQACGRAFLASELRHGIDSITRSSVEILSKRGLKKVGVDKYGQDLFTWTADLRLRIPPPFSVVPEQVEQYAQRIQCPLLVIKASDSPWYMSEANAEKILRVYQNNNPNFVFKTVEGGHHVHLNEPDKIAPEINSFLNKQFNESGTESKQNLPVDLF